MALKMQMEIGGNKFEVKSVSLDMFNDTGKADSTKMGKMSVVKVVDASSPALMGILLGGVAKKSDATLTVPGTSPVTNHVKYVLKDAVIHSIQIGGNMQDEKFTETLTIKFGNMDFTGDDKTGSYDAAKQSAST